MPQGDTQAGEVEEALKDNETEHIYATSSIQ
jgi:hypothetical protein